MDSKGNFEKFEDEDFNNKNISLNTQTNTNQVESKKPKPKFLQKALANKEIIGINMATGGNVSEKISENFMNKVNTNLSFIKEYFDVDVENIKEKIIASVMPMNKNFHQLVEKSTDLYGPFWILTTLVFVVTVTGNFSTYINSNDKDNFKYNFNFIPYAAIYIYGIGFGIPIVLYLIMKFMFQVAVSPILNISLYGYSFTILAPILFLCIIPLEITDYIFLGYFLFSSSYFLVYNMGMLLVEKAEKSKNIILGIIIAFQALMTLVLKFYFFGNINEKKL